VHFGPIADCQGMPHPARSVVQATK